MKTTHSDLCGQSAYRLLEMKLHTSDLVWATSLLTPDYTWNWNYTQVICAGNRLTDAQNFVSPFLIYPDNSINSPNGGLVIIIRLQNLQPNGSWYPVAGNAYLHTGGVLNRRSGGEGTSLRCALYFSYFSTSFSFSLWLGEWDHFTRRTETFQKISNMYGYFLYILHCMDFSVNFRWWGEGGMVTAAGPSCGPSAQGVKPPSVLRPGCCCYMQEIAPVDYWHQAHSSSLGGPRHFGTGLTVSPFGTVWATPRVPCSVTSVVVRRAALRGWGLG